MHLWKFDLGAQDIKVNDPYLLLKANLPSGIVFCNSEITAKFTLEASVLMDSW